ncbi:MAG: hypothetical protein RL260_182 [Pseudomonadota bacterium]
MKVALLLLVLTLLVVLLPLLPAFREWWKPTDVTPLPIDETDALEPEYLARRFSGLLAPALEHGLIALGGVPLVHLPASAVHAPWPLNAQEVRTGRTRRIWHTEGDCVLPERLHCLAEMSARGALRTSAGRTYRALLSGTQLSLAPRTRIIRWAHAHSLSIGDHCQAGRSVWRKVCSGTRSAAPGGHRVPCRWRRCGAGTAISSATAMSRWARAAKPRAACGRAVR